MAGLADVVREELGLELRDVDVDERLTHRAIRDGTSPQQFFDEHLDVHARDFDTIDSGFDAHEEGIDA